MVELNKTSLMETARLKERPGNWVWSPFAQGFQSMLIPVAQVLRKVLRLRMDLDPDLNHLRGLVSFLKTNFILSFILSFLFYFNFQILFG